MPDWIKPGVAVLYMGITRVEDLATGKGKLAGDVHPTSHPLPDICRRIRGAWAR